MTPKLTIVVPTYNRQAKLVRLISTLLPDVIPTEYKSQIQIIVSDNRSVPSIELPPNTDWHGFQVVKPPHHLLTAEENLLFGLSKAEGEYIWILGDDDVPRSDGFAALWKCITQGLADYIIFNSVVTVGSTNELKPRLNLEYEYKEYDLVDFLGKAGFWSIPAGFSTTVFRNAFFDQNFMADLHADNLVIYSHVTTLLKSFHNRKFFVNTNILVEYNHNSFDDESVSESIKDSHWIKYSKSVGIYYRYPWLSSFIKQWKLLNETVSGIRILRFDLILDQSHSGTKFFLLDSMFAMLIDQLIYNIDNEEATPIPDQDFYEILEFFAQFKGQMGRIARDLIAMENFSEKKDWLVEVRESFLSPIGQLNRRFQIYLNSGLVFLTPYGLIWTPKFQPMEAIFQNLNTPRNCVTADDMEKLELEIKHYHSGQPITLQNEFSQTEFEQIRRLAQAWESARRFIPRWIRVKLR